MHKRLHNRHWVHLFSVPTVIKIYVYSTYKPPNFDENIIYTKILLKIALREGFLA